MPPQDLTIELAKRCTTCGDTKVISKFPPNKRYRLGVSSRCKACAQEATYRWRRANADVYRANAAARMRAYYAANPGLSARQSAARRKANREFVRRVLSERSCTDCGTSDIQLLEFDHVRGTKSAGIAHLVQHGGIARIQEEIAKCEVVCANCHRKRTIDRAGHHRLLGAPPAHDPEVPHRPALGRGGRRGPSPAMTND